MTAKKTEKPQATRTGECSTTRWLTGLGRRQTGSRSYYTQGGDTATMIPSNLWLPKYAIHGWATWTTAFKQAQSHHLTTDPEHVTPLLLYLQKCFPEEKGYQVEIPRRSGIRICSTVPHFWFFGCGARFDPTATWSSSQVLLTHISHWRQRIAGLDFPYVFKVPSFIYFIFSRNILIDLEVRLHHR